jgi:hypothetical protein
MVLIEFESDSIQCSTQLGFWTLPVYPPRVLGHCNKCVGSLNRISTMLCDDMVYCV